MMTPHQHTRPRNQNHYAGGCTQPVLLRGRIDHIDGNTGELLHRYTTVHEPGGVLPVACKTRRASRCLPCAEVYRADTYQLIRAGLTGGKRIPATVATHPCVLPTLREKNGRILACRPRRGGRTCLHDQPLSCNERHTRNDSRLGEPLCPDCYDYTGSVLFNAHAPELWRRFTIALRRALARLAGMTNAALPNKCASRSPRWPNTSAVASSTSTPSSASMASAARPHPHPPGPPSTCSPPPSPRPQDRFT